jgi:DNA-binding PadR family transcriptional regulator
MHRHFGHFAERAWRSRHGWGGRMQERGERRGRRGFGRFFEHGDLRFVILALLKEQPRHGYELIKELEDRTGGAYRPSAGVIYPTLSLLEDEGLIRPSAGETGRKLFELTDAGAQALESNKDGVEAVFERMGEASQNAGPGRPRIGRAMMNLGIALKTRLSQPTTPEQLDRIVSMIDDTAAAIERT